MLACLLLFSLTLIGLYLYSPEIEHHKSFSEIRRYHWDLEKELWGVGIKEYPTIKSYERKDWHDYEFMKLEAARKGLGEQGRPVFLTDPTEIELDKRLEKQEGVHAIVSDKISVNRSINDTRPIE